MQLNLHCIKQNTLKTESCYNANFVITCDTKTCNYDNFSATSDDKVGIMMKTHSYHDAKFVITGEHWRMLLWKPGYENFGASSDGKVGIMITLIFQWEHMVVLCFVLLWLCCDLLIDLCDLFAHILQGCFTGIGAIIWLPQCQWSNPEWYGWNLPAPNHNKTQQIMNHVHISWGAL